jgi:hypothetical protein
MTLQGYTVYVIEDTDEKGQLIKCEQPYRNYEQARKMVTEAGHPNATIKEAEYKPSDYNLIERLKRLGTKQ